MSSRSSQACKGPAREERVLASVDLNRPRARAGVAEPECHPFTEATARVCDGGDRPYPLSPPALSAPMGDCPTHRQTPPPAISMVNGGVEGMSRDPDQGIPASPEGPDGQCESERTLGQRHRAVKREVWSRVVRPGIALIQALRSWPAQSAVENSQHVSTNPAAR